MKYIMTIRFQTAVVLLICMVSCSGCAKLMHIGELLRIKGYSDNKELQDKCVQKNDENFEFLLTAVKEERMSEYADKKSILKSFGDPILSSVYQENGKTAEKWLYRYAMKYFDSEKVYLYFDEKDKLVKWEYVEPLKEEEK